ncbi:MAG: tyrosine-type recombinase/integrase [Desulfovibrionaceae bacterium]|nr:tyrosine-type recombinase/integrase [Desulfovibrionaceae bacterium]
MKKEYKCLSCVKTQRSKTEDERMDMDGVPDVGSDAEQRVAIAEFYNRWVSYIDATPATIATYRKNIRQFFAYLEERGIERPSREDIVGYRDYLKSRHKPTTVQGYLVAVKLFFGWMEQEGLYPDVARRIKGAKLDVGHKKDCLTVPQVVRVLAGIDRSTLRGLRDYAILSVMVTTGLREISIVRANVGDMRVLGDVVVLYYQGKGHEERVEYVKLAAPVEVAVRAYLCERGDTQEGSPLFTSLSNKNSGQRMTTRSVSRILKERLVDVGLESERLTGHSFRHTAATLNLLNGGTVEETQQLLGHRNVNTTLIYSHGLERMKNCSEERIAGVIFG